MLWKNTRLNAHYNKDFSLLPEFVTALLYFNYQLIFSRLVTTMLSYLKTLLAITLLLRIFHTKIGKFPNHHKINETQHIKLIQHTAFLTFRKKNTKKKDNLARLFNI